METNFELGATYVGKIRFIRPFGIIVECNEGEGWIHISELDNRHIDSIFDEYEIDEEITMKCIGIDDRGRVRMSHRAIACEELGLEYEPTVLPVKGNSRAKYGSGKASRRNIRRSHRVSSFSSNRPPSRYGYGYSEQRSSANLIRNSRSPYRRRVNSSARCNSGCSCGHSECNSSAQDRHECAKNRSNILGVNNRFRPNTKNRRISRFNHFKHADSKNLQNQR